jgi:hypothetical protein
MFSDDQNRQVLTCHCCTPVFIKDKTTCHCCMPVVIKDKTKWIPFIFLRLHNFSKKIDELIMVNNLVGDVLLPIN